MPKSHKSTNCECCDIYSSFLLCKNRSDQWQGQGCSSKLHWFFCRNTLSCTPHCNCALLSWQCFHMSPKCVKLLFSVMGPPHQSVNVHSSLMYHFGDFDHSGMFSLGKFSQLSHVALFLSSSLLPVSTPFPSLVSVLLSIPLIIFTPPLLTLLSSHLPSFSPFCSTTSSEGKQMGSQGCETEREANSHTQRESGLGK